MNFIKKNWPMLLLIAVGFFIYYFNIHNTLFWDDEDWIINNRFVHSFSLINIKAWFTKNTLAGIGLRSNYYRPFLFFTFALNYIISGSKPFGYHLLSNLIHIANALIIFVVLQKFFKRRIVPFLTSLFFLVHPLQTEAITYISGRGDPLYVFFSLVSLWLFIRIEEGVKNKRLFIFLSLLSLVLGLLSREVAIVFPPLLVLFYVAFISKDKFWAALKKAFVKTWPYFAVTIVYGILRLTVLNFINTLNFYTNHNVYADNLYVRIFTFFKVLSVYLGLLFAPVRLHMERGMDPQLTFWHLSVWLSFVGIIALIAWILFLYRRDYKNNEREAGSSEFRVWLLGAGWFFIALAPVSGITPINALLYEHWLYLPLVGFFLIVSFYIERLINLLKNKGKVFYYYLFLVLLCVYFAFLSGQSIRRNIIWGKPIDFFRDILRYEPDSVRINNNLGNLYFDKGDVKDAQYYYEKAVETEDIFPQPHFNLGSILQSQGDIFGAVKEYEKAIAIDPNFYYPYPNLISIYARNGDFDKASKYVMKFNDLKPNDPRILYNAAIIISAKGDNALALKLANQGLNFAGEDKEVEVALRNLITKLTKKR